MDNFKPEDIDSVNAVGEAGMVNNIETPVLRKIAVRFRDITGQKYETTLLFSEDGISVTKAPGRIK